MRTNLDCFLFIYFYFYDLFSLFCFVSFYSSIWVSHWKTQCARTIKLLFICFYLLSVLSLCLFLSVSVSRYVRTYWFVCMNLLFTIKPEIVYLKSITEKMKTFKNYRHFSRAKFKPKIHSIRVKVHAIFPDCEEKSMWLNWSECFPFVFFFSAFGFNTWKPSGKNRKLNSKTEKNYLTHNFSSPMAKKDWQSAFARCQ